jgi:membrane-bound ClpP family serine protease
MSKLYLFIIRLLVGGLIAFIIIRIFRPDAGAFYVIGVGAVLVGLAYVLENIRKRKSSS